MAEEAGNNRRLFARDTSDLSTSSTVIDVGSPLPSPSLSAFSPRQRNTYHRVTTSDDVGNTILEDGGEDIADTLRKNSEGLGIAASRDSPSTAPGHARRVSAQSFARFPVGGKGSPLSNSVPGSSDPLVSPGWDTQNLSSAKTAYDPGAPFGDEERAPYHRSASSLHSSYNHYTYEDTERLNKRMSVAPSLKSTRSAYDKDFNELPHACPTAKSFYQGRWNWLAISIICLAIFSAVFSGIFFGIAVRAPRWGRAIHTGGSLSPGTANVLTQIFAKLIELSFVTVFVAFLGQVLSRRAFSEHSRGVSLAEMNMRNWIMQPGSMITHYETVQFAAISLLGMLSITVALLAMLYSTAATALVAPQLKFGSWDNKLMSGLVKASFANPIYLADTCQTPIQKVSWNDDYSPSNVGDTCLQLDHAAQGYHNYVRYMSYWAELANSGNASNTLQQYRPQGFGLFNENVTVNASWIQIIDTEAVSEKYGRAVNNVTLAMPHTGVVQAGSDPKNGIMQPSDLDGLGIYNIHAALPSPFVNVLCANVEAEILKPLVYANMTNVTLNATLDFSEASTYWFTHLNWTAFNSIKKTDIDEVFGWTKPSDRPAFYKFPIDFNTILNNTQPGWGKDSLYLLGKGDKTETDYLLCKMKAGLTPNCSTEFVATGMGGTLKAHCEDPKDHMAYIRGNHSRVETTSLDWYNVGAEALRSLSLNTGVSDGAASNSRLLTQLMLKEKKLNAALPSPAEALAVLVGCTLLMSSQDSPFVEFWNYTGVTILNPGQYQVFNSSIRAQEYASGGIQAYQRAFHVVLFSVFALNLFVLIYFLVNKGLVTDFSEPPNLFSLAVNSPPSHLLAGSCGGGPEGKQYRVNWAIEKEGDHLYMTDKKASVSGYRSVGADGGDGGGLEEIELGNTTPITPGPKIGRSKTKFHKAYNMLSKRKSML